MEEELLTGSAPRRSSTRPRKIGARVGAALADPLARAQAARDRLDALESDNVAPEPIDLEDDEDASMDEDEGGGGGGASVFAQKMKVPKSTKRKTRRAKAMERTENIRKAPRGFLDLLQEANLEALPANMPSYLKAAVGPPSSTARRHFCSVCGYIAPYTCIRCGARFCSCRCEVIHTDTRCQKFLM